ncbi:MAG: PaaI family thioesterase [Pseudomonadota bacterium]
MSFEIRDPEWEARCRGAFAAQGMMRTLGVQIVEVAPGRVTLRAPIRAETAQHHGYAHAALAFAMGDTAQGFAAGSLMAPGMGFLTVEMKINLIAPAKGQFLLAEGRVERPGRRLTATSAEIFAEGADGARRRTAILLGTMTGVEDG